MLWFGKVSLNSSDIIGETWETKKASETSDTAENLVNIVNIAKRAYLNTIEPSGSRDSVGWSDSVEPEWMFC